MTATLILSPHQDDAALSLWHVLRSDGTVTVINVFAGEPSTTELGWWDATTGATDPQTRARERRDEDRAALALAGRHPTDLEFLDLQYRAAEQPLQPIVEAIAASVGPDTSVLAPAGLGGHLDHALVRDAALALAERGLRVALYADVPHAARDGWPLWVTNGGGGHPPSDAWREDMAGSGIDLGELEPRVHALDADEATRKLAALAEYRTQLPALNDQYLFDERPEALRYEILWELPAAAP
ncbi:MAG: PIG-L deacetylase family protein [Solirubrobacterales bacterium]